MIKTTSADHLDHWIEILAIVLLSSATLLTAWGGYQVSRWGGEQTKLDTQSVVSKADAAKFENQAFLNQNLHIGLFVQYAEAWARGESRLAQFYYQRFPPMLKSATNAWLETKPLQTPGAPLTPFAMPQYRLKEIENAEQARQSSMAQYKSARRASTILDRYQLRNVTLAIVLFLAGISTKLERRESKMVVLGLAVASLIAAIVGLATLPIL